MNTTTDDADADFTAGIADMNQRAEAAVREGQLDIAEEVYGLLLQIVPQHTLALGFLGMRAFQRGDYGTSADLMQRAVSVEPGNAILQQNLGMALAAGGERRRALDAFQKAIALKPDDGLTYFYIGQILQDTSRLPEAIAAYRKGYRLNPRLAQAHLDKAAPPAIRDVSRRAAEAFERHKRNLQKQAVERLLANAGEEPPGRLRQFLDQQYRQTTPDYAHPLQRPSVQYYPGLTPRPWYERSEFDWMPAIEAGWDTIRNELAAVMAQPEELSPYVNHSGYTPEEWRMLAASTAWSSYHLMRGGNVIPEHCRRCPKTLDALEQVPLARARNHAPEAFFSILAPGAHIPPHHGLANTKLAIHLPLVIPEDCAIRVGDETRSWREGECLVFDDSFEHEAWNRSDATRAVLIFEVWNPELTPLEIRAIQTLFKTAAQFEQTFALDLP